MRTAGSVLHPAVRTAPAQVFPVQGGHSGEWGVHWEGVGQKKSRDWTRPAQQACASPAWPPVAFLVPLV